MRILFQNKHKRSLDLGRQEVRVEVGKDLSMELYVDQMGPLTTWQSRTLSHYGIYWCRSPCWSWGQVIAHTEREDYMNRLNQYGRRWSIVKVSVFDCNPERGIYCIKICLTLQKVMKEDLGLWYVGYDQFLVDTLVRFRVEEVRPVWESC
jgi:hypothetical protein